MALFRTDRIIVRNPDQLHGGRITGFRKPTQPVQGRVGESRIRLDAIVETANGIFRIPGLLTRGTRPTFHVSTSPSALDPSSVPQRPVDESWESKVVDLRPEERFSLESFLFLPEWRKGEKLSIGEIAVDRSEYSEGYGFLRFWHNAHTQKPILSIKYDVATAAATQLSARNFSAIEVKAALMSALDEKTQTLRACFRILGLRLEMLERDRDRLACDQSQREARDRELEQIKPRADIDFGFLTDVSPGFFITQGEYTIARYSEECKILRTGGLGPCVALILYDPEVKVGAIFHIDSQGRNNLRILFPINNAFALMEAAGAKQIRAYLVGGNSADSRETILGIQQSFVAGMQVAGMSILQMHTSENVALDLATGKLHRYPETSDQGIPEVSARLLQVEAEVLLSAPLRLIQAKV